MKVRITATLDIDAETWKSEYGMRFNATSGEIRADVLTHVENTLHETYVTHLELATDVTVRGKS